MSERIGELCRPHLSESRDILRYRLSAEEYLLKWLTKDNVGKTLTLSFRKRILMPLFFTITLSGTPCNPMETENVENEFSNGILRSLGIAPSYSYSKEKNVLQFDVKGHSDKKMAVFAGVIAAALLLGIFGSMFIPVNIRTGLNEIVLTPINDLFLTLLGLISGPLIFLSVAWGIYSIGDTASLNKIGRSVIFTFIRHTFLACAAGLSLVFLFDLTYSNTSVSLARTSELVSLLFGCVPKNIIEPFYSGNTLQIIFLAIVIGICLIYLGKKTAGIAKALEEINLLLQFIMEFISGLVPGLIFVVIVSLFWSGTLNVVKEAWRFFLILILGAVLIAAVLILIISVRYKVKPGVFVRKCLPSFVIAFLTASSAAAFDKTVLICNKKLGVDPSVTSFAVPLGMVMHSPVSALNNLLVVLFFSEIYGIECSYVTFIIAVICATILAVATPPIRGGGLIVYTMLFTQFGIPPEGIAAITAIDLVTDFIITGMKILCLFPGIILAADRVGMLNKDVLRTGED